ncbi:MAG: glycine zipper 2TM domain-containing protein [Rhodospirillaceae bacterium]|nr:glycine zipper 2TM domain-containing protein [Rhodospirillaceae bacterium]
MTQKSGNGAVKKALLVLLMASLLGACANNESGSRQVGAVLGGVLGGIVGSKFGGGSGKAASIALGAGLGAVMGDEIARRLTERDRQMAAATLDDALENGEANKGSGWSNPESGNNGTARADETYEQAKTGKDCRDFETTVFTDDGESTATGTACRNEDGSWQVVREPNA